MATLKSSFSSRSLGLSVLSLVSVLSPVSAKLAATGLTVTLNDESGLEIQTRKAPMGYLAASELAAKKARADSRTIRKRG